MRFMVLLRAEPDAQAAVLGAMAGGHAALAEAGVLLAGGGLRPPIEAATVRAVAPGRRLVDGSRGDTVSDVCGWWLLECASESEAIERLRRVGAPAGAVLELREAVLPEPAAAAPAGGEA
ncbi:MAG TPA: hypothetical protein VIL49_15150 [Capillimicrobium sp.]|jgi:hypothetical protein